MVAGCLDQTKPRRFDLHKKGLAVIPFIIPLLARSTSDNKYKKLRDSKAIAKSDAEERLPLRGCPSENLKI